ncbi:S-4TM family putative pore-forming effector [Limnofasciculus baicalensis]|uniref:S-4TM family putative pore-forming effector n=1 Tax=Limnofasciculus baicalensis BBK-W-15 TaxID=2699891 RepID=A0AAE3GVI2_9CYAN|nr:S-4TM family putative pore-forming effector [Limnofasciculus baicalensis]MCP2731425.1 S-4TM family putative pore-forming effector [Limnofasciculus baicalensis BBK-W-15]
MNNIPQEQNTQRSLELLAAQRQLYSDAKNLQMVSVIMSVPVVIVWSILIALFPLLAVYAALWGIIAALLELLVFSRLQKSTQEKAAKIQQIFDCEVLQFNWASLNCGIRVEPETIIDAYNRYKRKNRNITKIQNWYPVIVDQLPIHQARIICQRSNVWWDAQLRRRYSKWIVFILFTLIVIVLLIGLIGGLTLEKFLLAVLAPLTPAFVFSLRQYTEHNEAAVRLDRLREKAEALVQEIINRRYTPQDLERESDRLQTQIYDNRRRSPLILDWLYSRLRNEDEEKMNKGAESLVQELSQNP